MRFGRGLCKEKETINSGAKEWGQDFSNLSSPPAMSWNSETVLLSGWYIPPGIWKNKWCNTEGRSKLTAKLMMRSGWQSLFKLRNRCHHPFWFSAHPQSNFNLVFLLYCKSLLFHPCQSEFTFPFRLECFSFLQANFNKTMALLKKQNFIFQMIPCLACIIFISPFISTQEIK